MHRGRVDRSLFSQKHENSKSKNHGKTIVHVTFKLYNCDDDGLLTVHCKTVEEEITINEFSNWSMPLKFDSQNKRKLTLLCCYFHLSFFFLFQSK